jgi:hypothetical protein
VVPVVWPGTAVAAGDAVAEPPGFVVSAVPSAASCLVATAGCDAVAAVGSVLPALSELADAVVVAAAAFEGAVFEVTVLGAEPSDATVAVAGDVSAATVAPVCVVAAALTVGWPGVFAVVAVVVAAPEVGVAVIVAASAVVMVACANDDPSVAVADWLAAMAAAAIASGAVPLPDVGEPDAGEPVVGVDVTATVTGTTTAIGLGVAGLVPPCGVGVELVAESADDVSPDDDVAVD